MWPFLRKLKMQPACNQTTVLWAFFLEKWGQCLYTNLYTNFHVSFIHNGPKLELTQTSFHRWIIKLCDSHTMEYYLAIKTNELISGYIETRMNCEEIPLIEKKSQYQKITYWMIPFIQYSWNDKIIKMANRFLLQEIRD